MSGEATRRHIEKHGHDVVLINYALGGEDAYGDATRAATSSTIRAIREMISVPNTEMGMSGAIPTGNAKFNIKDTVVVNDGSSTQPSEIVDGATYTVEQADNQRNGQITLTAERNGV